MNIEDLSIFGLYSQKENKVTAALLQVLGFGGQVCSARSSVVLLISSYYRLSYWENIS